MSKQYLTRAEVSQHLAEMGIHCAKTTLAKLATTGGGPAYRVFGNRALYTVDDLTTWITGKLSPAHCSTSTGVTA